MSYESFDRDEISAAGLPLALSEVYAGRQVVYRRRKAVVLAVLPCGTPSGSEVVLARVRFPRGGEQTVFAGQLEARP
jgi:hypothetical protein